MSKILVSTPIVKDSIFYKSTILILKNEDIGNVGVITNKRMNQKIKDVWEEVNPNLIVPKNNNLRIGGPVYGKVFLVHKSKKYSEEEVFPNTYQSCHPENIEKIISNKRTRFEMYIGFCTWQEEQLEYELERSVWWDIKPHDKFVFGDNYEEWDKEKIRQDVEYLKKMDLSPRQNYLMN